MTLLELCNVTKEYSVRSRKLSWFRRKKHFTAVNQVNLTLSKGECLGIVGESGSGKSTIAKLIMKIESVTSGQVLLDGKLINSNQIKDIQLYKRLQMVLQDSSSSLHPKMNVQEILTEPLRNYFSKNKEWRTQCIQLLELVNLDASYLIRYPHQLSGGQKQRVCIAKALAVKPDIIIFDESIASLDSTSQTSIIRMLKRIQKQEQLSYLFITHDLQSTKELCDRVAVMYQGEIIETFHLLDVGQLKHPYSNLLFQTLEDNER
ncbi:ABC transporter ATP-binding protein [Peribacillus asahii]|uniref:ABC transporter ATP-binding protein n=1 Tax=Peribacillus asahii TaxID=228899 RepID=UPI000FD80495|nr:dipeptide/oligopeptide/nickel ABC transporter ATP-binding protein [Peribacillus asahii]